MCGGCWARADSSPYQAGSGLPLGPYDFPPAQSLWAFPARWLSSGWRQETGQRQRFRRPDIFPISDPQDCQPRGGCGGRKDA